MTTVEKDQYGYMIPAFLLCPWGGKINMATSPLPSWGPNSGERSIWRHHPCLPGVPIVGKDEYGYIIPDFLGSAWWGKINVATSPLPSWGPHSGER